MKKSTKEEFIEKAKLIHGDKYTYEKVVYINVRKKVTITCEQHGDFTQLPRNHTLLEQGCPICGYINRANSNIKSKDLLLKNFLEKAKIVHGDKFDYSSVVYIDSEIKVKIICEIHGVFEQTPKNHIYGSGCTICGGSNKSNTEEFIQKSILVHGDKYTYGKVIYENARKLVVITCKKHGNFEQFPNSHLSGYGCISCSHTKKSSTEEFIEKAKLVHNDKYTYDNVIYANCKDKVEIICKQHGIFKQAPENHLNGQGCPNCKTSYGELKVKNLLEKNNINFKTQYWFIDLKNIGYLYFDFGIIDDNDNLLYLIEFNGIQHYKYNDFMHKCIENFQDSQIRDQLKIDYCLDNNIPLYIIRYDENIEDSIESIINIEAF